MGLNKCTVPNKNKCKGRFRCAPGLGTKAYGTVVNL